MKKLEKKKEILVQIRAKYNNALCTIQTKKRREAAQRWIDKLNLKILEVEKQLLKVQQ